MESFGIGIAGLFAAGLASLGAFGLAFRQHRRRRGSAARTPGKPRSAADRLEALAAAQAELALRLDTLAAKGGAPEERLQAMAGQLLGLVRDKNATLETALAGLDQLRARMRALEQMGEPAEARALVETLQGRIDAVAAAQAAGTAALEARLEALAAPAAETASALAERLVRLQESRDQGAEAVSARLGQIETRFETRFGALEAGREALKRLEGRIEALQAAQGAAKQEIAGLEARVGGPVKELAHELARLHAQKEALAGQLAARLGALEAELRSRDPEPALARLAERLDALAPLEARLAGVEKALAERDPRAALDRFAERLEAVQGRLTALEGAENPFAEISDQLTRLCAQKDATAEAVLARLAPLEAKLAEIGARDPEARLETMDGRLGRLEDGAGAVAALAAELARLQARTEAGAEALAARLAPFEAKLAGVEKGLAEGDPRAALDRFAERLEAVQGRLAALEGAENPFAEISDQLGRLYAQKDAAVETVFARLAPLEARLAETEKAIAEGDPRAPLDRFAERLEAVQGRLAALEGAENPFTEISDQLGRLYAQKDATAEAVLARLAPLEARLAEIGARDPAAALAGTEARIEARLEALQGRLGAVEAGEAAVGEIAGQLGRLHAQKDAALEAVLARLAPLEARLAETEQGVERGMARLAPLEAQLAEGDPRAALEALRERLEALQRAQGETAAAIAALKAADGGALGEVADQLTRLYAQKDAGVTALLARLAPLEARLAAVESRPAWDPAAEAARDEAQGVAVRLIAGLAAAEQTALFAERLTRIEASLPEPGAKGARATDLDSIWSLPRVVSLHQR
jgi:localization factor PodJL